jgi:hypothetical protein
MGKRTEELALRAAAYGLVGWLFSALFGTQAGIIGGVALFGFHEVLDPVVEDALKEIL